MTLSVLPPTSFDLLRYLTSPVVAVTTSAGGRSNGMIANSAQRASLVPSVQRVSVYVSKTNFSHDLIYTSGVFGLHLLRRDQWHLIRTLGLQSGRDGDKLHGIELITGETGCPLLADARAAYECRVVNAMDAGAATFFLGEVVSMRDGAGTDGAGGEHGRDGGVMTSDYLRTHMPDDMRQLYLSNLERAQHELEPLARHVDVRSWPGPSARP